MNHYLRTTLLTCILLLLSIDAMAQNMNNELELALGNANGLIKDEVFSPLNYKSSGGTLSLHYSSNTKRDHLFLLSVDLQTLEMSTNVSDQFGSDLVKLNMEAAYLFRLKAHSDRYTRYYLGFDIHSNGNLITYEDEYTLSNSGTYVSHRGVGIQALTTHSLKKNTVHLRFKMPVIGKVYRSPYNQFTKTMNDDRLFAFIYTNGELGAIHNFFNPSVAASISRPLAGKLHVRLGYEIEYLKSSVHQSITNLQGRFLIATSFKF